MNKMKCSAGFKKEWGKSILTDVGIICKMYPLSEKGEDEEPSLGSYHLVYEGGYILTWIHV